MDELAARYGRREAVVFRDERYTWLDVQHEVDRLARGLIALGLPPGEPVALLMGNRPEWLFVDLATAKLGAPLVALNTWYQSHELEYVLSHSAATTLVLVDRFLRNDYLESLRELCPELDSATPGALASARLPALRRIVVLGEEVPSGAFSYTEVLRRGESVSPVVLSERQTQVRPTDLANILYTSGTTAFPKGVTLAHLGMIENSFGIGERQRLTEHDRLWLSVPFFFALAATNAIIAALTHGTTIVIQEAFDAGEALRLIEAERCTCYYGMPNVTVALWHHPDRAHRDLSSLRTGVTIGSPDLVQLAVDLGVSGICNVYGMTETYGNAAVCDTADPLEQRLTTQGLPLPGNEIRVVDPVTNRILLPGEPGELRVRGYVMPGYYDDPKANALAFDDDGFLRTGDQGFLDDDGRVHYLARYKELIKTGGINVAPQEVEEYLGRHPKIKQVHVLGLPDPVKEELVTAVIELRPGQTATADEIRRYCQGHIASYKVPARVFFVADSDLPRTATGKVQKRLLREQLVSDSESPS
ncbi:MAG: AMP-binding protein [Chloroflexi bacterium]|nr:AMP-binding protein [Chloroflexota bacterium]